MSPYNSVQMSHSRLNLSIQNSTFSRNADTFYTRKEHDITQMEHKIMLI